MRFTYADCSSGVEPVYAKAFERNPNLWKTAKKRCSSSSNSCSRADGHKKGKELTSNEEKKYLINNKKRGQSYASLIGDHVMEYARESVKPDYGI